MSLETKKRGRPAGTKNEPFALVPLESLIAIFNPSHLIPIQKELAVALGLTQSKTKPVTSQIEDDEDTDEDENEEMQVEILSNEDL